MSNVEQQLKDLQARVTELEDLRALQDLLAQYSYTADLRRIHDYVDLFTEDGVIDLIDMNSERFVGPQRLLEFISKPEATDLGNIGIHVATPTVFFIDGDHATGEGYSLLFARDMSVGGHLRGADEPIISPIKVDIVHANYSHWTFRKVNGTWKIAEREIRLLASPTAGDMFKISLANTTPAN